jgi:hypothetical protein
VKRQRELIVANMAGLVILLIALLVGWREAAGFGLAVLVVLNLMVLLRARGVGPGHDRDE